MLEPHGEKIGGGKWRLPGEEFIGNASQRILITFFGAHALKLFGGHVRGSANDGTILDTARGECARNTEISKERCVVCVEKNIFGFEVAVNNVLLMCVGQGRSHL